MVPQLSKKVLIPEQFWNTSVTPMNFFGTVGQKNIDKAVMLPRPMHEKFRYQEVLQTQKIFTTKFFGPVRPKKLKRKIVISLSCALTFFHTRKTLKHRRVPPRSSSAL